MCNPTVVAANLKPARLLQPEMIKEDTRSCGDGDPAAARSMFCSFIKVLDERAISETLESWGEAVPKRSRTGELPWAVSATCAAAGRQKRSRF